MNDFNFVGKDGRFDLIGKIFKSERHVGDVDWIVLKYRRGGNWTCEEQEHKTTCDFQQSEILAGLIE